MTGSWTAIGPWTVTGRAVTGRVYGLIRNGVADAEPFLSPRSEAGEEAAP